MSIETLLEAAKYLEYRSELKARGEVPKDYSSYVSGGTSGNRSYNLFYQPSAYTVENERGRSSEESRAEKRRTGGSGTREVHNKLEKNRRAHLKKCFETLKKQIPNMDEKKTSNLWILRSALRYIQTLKRKERECEFEMERLTKEKSYLLRKFGNLKKELTSPLDQSDTGSILQDDANDTNSTSTATECGPQSDVEDDKISEEGCVKSPEDSSNGTCITVYKSEISKVERETSSPNQLNQVSSANCLKTSPTVVTTMTPESSVIKETNVKPFLKTTLADFVTTASESSGIIKLEPSAAPNLRLNRTPQVHVGSFAFPAQVVPHLGLNGNGGILTSHSTLQLVAPPTVRVLTPSGVSARSLTVSSVANSNQPSTLQSNVSSAAVAVQSNPSATVHVVKTNPSVARVLQQPSTVSPNSSATIVKGLIASGGTTSSPIAIAQLTVKPNNSLTNIVHHQPILTAATVNFQTVGNAVTSNSSPPSVTSVAGQIVTTSMKPVTQIAQVVAPNTMHVSSVGQVIATGPSLQTAAAPLMSVLPSINHSTVTQVIAPTHLGKVLSTPLIKSVGQIPIIQQQFLQQHLGTVSGQPIVMVTTQPNTLSSPTTTTQQADKINLPV